MQTGTYLGIEAVALLFLLRTHTLKHFCHWSFRSPEGLKSLQKIFQANRRKKVMEFGYQNTSFGRIKSTNLLEIPVKVSVSYSRTNEMKCMEDVTTSLA